MTPGLILHPTFVSILSLFANVSHIKNHTFLQSYIHIVKETGEEDISFDADEL